MASQTFEALEAFLAQPQRPEGTLRYHEVQGFLFTVASCPELVPINDWLPILFNDQHPAYASIDEQDRIVGGLIRLYNDMNPSVSDERAALPVDCPLYPIAVDNLGPMAPVGQWARGFFAGHQWLEDIWNAYVPEEAQDAHATMLMILSFFSSQELAQEFAAEAKDGDLPGMAETMREVLPETVTEYAHVGRSIQKMLAEESLRQEPRRSDKIGRNEPCPCGSGRKYKKCCGASAA